MGIEKVVKKSFIAKFFDKIIDSFYTLRSKGLISQKIIDIYIDPFARNIFTRHPEVDIGKCTLCKTCIDVCPIENIYMEDKKIKLNIDKCIRCYCCSEMCPKGAMDLKYGKIGRLLRGS